jgi:hypothetical protein
LEDTRQAQERQGKVLTMARWLKEFDEISAGDQNIGKIKNKETKRHGEN